MLLLLLLFSFGLVCFALFAYGHCPNPKSQCIGSFTPAVALTVASEVNALQFRHHMGHKGYDTVDIGRNLMTRKPSESTGVDFVT